MTTKHRFDFVQPSLTAPETIGLDKRANLIVFTLHAAMLMLWSWSLFGFGGFERPHRTTPASKQTPQRVYVACCEAFRNSLGRHDGDIETSLP